MFPPEPLREFDPQIWDAIEHENSGKKITSN